MSRRTTITMIRIALAIAGIVILVTPIQSNVNSSAFYKGKVMGTAAIALALLVTAIPWGRPPSSSDGEAEEL
jgi:hypothetical protein